MADEPDKPDDEMRERPPVALALLQQLRQPRDVRARGTDYNPGPARNKRIQASVYFSWPLAAKCWPS